MKSKNSTLRNLFSIAAIFILAILASLSVFYFNINPAFSLSVDNPNFSNNMSDSTNTPSSPSSYTFVDGSFKTVSYNPQSTSTDQPNITAGVVNIESQGYSKRSSDQDNFALMISSKKGDVSNTVKYGYTSSQFNLSAESYYSISVDVYVDNAEKLGCLYLLDSNNSIYASYKQIGSANRWMTYMFLVKTDDYSSADLKLAMFLEGNGTVLFDSVYIKELSKSELENLKANHSNNYKYIAPTTNNVISQTEFSTSTLTTVETSANTTIENSRENDNTFASSVKITNSEAAHSKFETSSNFLTFEQNRNYRVTFSVKAADLNGKVKLQLVQTNLEKDKDGNDVYDTDNNHALTISSNTSADLTNGFKKYSFFINSHPLKTTTYKLVVELGDSSSQTKGSVYLAGSVLASLTYTNYENASTGDNALKIDIANKTTNLSSDLKSSFMTNGRFDIVKNTDYSKTYPAAPASWTVGTGANTQLYGVVNTTTAEFDKFVLSNTFTSEPVNPGNANGFSSSNNVLMMYNSVTDTLSYTSEKDKSLEAKTYHRFSINVLTQHSTLNLYLVASIDGKEVVLSSLKNIATDGIWHNVDLYIYTGIHQLSVGVKAEMNSNGFGYAYLDDATFDFAQRGVGEYLRQPTKAQFDAIQTSSNGKLHISKVDLSNLIDADSSSRYATPTHFDNTLNSNIDFGVIDLTNDADVRYILNDNQNVQNFKSVDNSKILAIHAVDFVKQTFTSNIGYRFESGKYYLVKVKVYTQNMSSENETFGFGLGLTNFDEMFNNINTETENRNGWTTYSFYINSSDTTTSMLKLVFGDDSANLKGDAFIGDIVVDEIEADSFVETSNDTTLVLKTTTKNDDSNNNSSNNEETKNSNNTAWIIAIPSILTGAAIVLAIVGVTMRKVKFKKPVKKTKNAYDRNSKQSQQIYMRKATMIREEHLRELQHQLETLQNERSTYETQYKKDLSALRQLKIKRANPSEIAKLEKDMKQNQKHSAQIGSSIRSIELDIEFTNSNEYIKQVVKKLSSAKQDEQEQDNQ